MTNWGRIISTAPDAVAVSSKVLLTSLVLDNPGIAEVVRRTRGRFVITSDQAVVQEHHLGALGVIVVNDIALAAGAASLPGPVTNRNDEGWLLWEPIVGISSISDGGSGFGQYIGQEFDSKAMRRIEDGFSLALMVENASAAFVFEVTLGLSILSSRT